MPNDLMRNGISTNALTAEASWAIAFALVFRANVRFNGTPGTAVSGGSGCGSPSAGRPSSLMTKASRTGPPTT